MALFDVITDIEGLLIGDKGYLSRVIQDELRPSAHMDLHMPSRANMAETCDPRWV